jgi:hypothetical protein
MHEDRLAALWNDFEFISQPLRERRHRGLARRLVAVRRPCGLRDARRRASRTTAGLLVRRPPRVELESRLGFGSGTHADAPGLFS